MHIVTPAFKRKDVYTEYIIRQSVTFVPPAEQVCPCGFMVKLENDYKCNVCGRQIVFMLENNYEQKET